MCESAKESLPPGVQVDRYVREMSGWYGIDVEHVDVVDASRVDFKMGDVLTGILYSKP